MKKIILSLLCLSVAAPLLADGTSQLSDEKSRISYAIGMALGQNSFKRQGVTITTNEVDFDLVAQGMKAVATGGTPVMTDMEAQQALQAFSKQMQALRAAEATKSKAAGDAFLTANAKNPGVQILPDGLQYQVITNGTGAIPTPADTVTVNYRGTLIDGTEFDSSYKRGKPAEFPVAHVIPGWTEALEKMPVGSKWKLFIPSQLGYGERGTQGIPPNSVLVFDVELLDTKTPLPPAPPAPLTSDIIKVPSAAEMKNGAKIEVIKPGDVPTTQAATNK